MRSFARVANRMMLDQVPSSSSHSSSEPSWLDHIAVSRKNVGVVVELCPATSAKPKSLRSNAASKSTNATAVLPAIA